MKHEKFIGKGEKRWIGLVRKGKRKAAKACGFSFYLVDFVDTLKTPVNFYNPLRFPRFPGDRNPAGQRRLEVNQSLCGHIPYTPMMSLVRSSTTGMVMRMMPMKSMMTPDLIIFVMGTYPEA